MLVPCIAHCAIQPCVQERARWRLTARRQCVASAQQLAGEGNHYIGVYYCIACSTSKKPTRALYYSRAKPRPLKADGSALASQNRLLQVHAFSPPASPPASGRQGRPGQTQLATRVVDRNPFDFPSTFRVLCIFPGEQAALLDALSFGFFFSEREKKQAGRSDGSDPREPWCVRSSRGVELIGAADRTAVIAMPHDALENAVFGRKRCYSW